MAASGLLPGYQESVRCFEDKKRYLEKLAFMDGDDPYAIPRGEWIDDVDSWPAITYIHVGLYLLFTPSPYTKEDLQNYKSMDSYGRFLAGWVREVLVKRCSGDKVLMVAKVNHSQRLNEKPLVPWVLAEAAGKIITAHCNCMAGLGETCSHVASLLWAIEAGVRTRESLSVTDKKAYWVMPPEVKKAHPAPISEIKFSRHHRKSECEAVSSQYVPPPTEDEQTSFLATLGACKSKPGICSLVEPFADMFIPLSMRENLPAPLSSLYNPDLLSESYCTLLQVASTYNLENLTASQVTAVEEKTRGQAQSKLWFQMRSGRITASKVRAICHTDPSSPSISLITSICYPELGKFRSAATAWGCRHETTARSTYCERQKKSHDNFSVTDCGFFLFADHPFNGASPDGITKCICCGEGILEVKCPYCHKDDSFEESASDSQFCLEKTAASGYQLKRTHRYYYQVQWQLLCADKNFCDFVVWTNEDLHVERIWPSEEFQYECFQKCQSFFTLAILPELFGKFYSRPPQQQILHVGITTPEAVQSTEQMQSDNDKYCYCNGPEEGIMVACDNPSCTHGKWFHLECLRIKAPPRSRTWYCPDCRKCVYQRRKCSADAQNS